MKNNIPDGHVSKKKKNTYTVTFSLMINMDLFSACKHTPIALIMVNGKKQMNQYGWIKSREFPNPCANEMAKNHKKTIDKMGPKLATTIIEYLDKKTNKPVVQLYPESMYIFPEYGAEYKSHLNHATRRDFDKEVKKRMSLLNTISR